MTRRSRFWRCPVCGRRMVPDVDTATTAPVVATETPAASTAGTTTTDTTTKEA